MTHKIGFNKEKLRRLVRSKNDLHAAYLQVSGDISFIRQEQLPQFERMVKEADEACTQPAINREIFEARNNETKPKEIKFFMDYSPAEMPAVYQDHPISKKLSFANMQKYVAYRLELESLLQHQREISTKMEPLLSIIGRCKAFLEQNGITEAEHGIDLG